MAASMVALSALLVWGHAQADVILANHNSGTVPTQDTDVGMSFTIPRTESYDDVSLSFYSNAQATSPVAVGTAVILSAVFEGTPAQLGVGDYGFVAESTGTSNGAFTFDPGLVLQAGATYYVYVNGLAPYVATSEFPRGVTPGLYFSADANSFYGYIPSLGPDFKLSGTVAAVPEPSTAALTVLGALSLYTVRRRRLRANDGGSRAIATA
jgi:hypothetical protein